LVIAASLGFLFYDLIMVTEHDIAYIHGDISPGGADIRTRYDIQETEWINDYYNLEFTNPSVIQENNLNSPYKHLRLCIGAYDTDPTLDNPVEFITSYGINI
jgi:hypothetical protein